MSTDWKTNYKRRKTKDLRVMLPPTLIDQIQRDANLSNISVSEYVCRLALRRAIKVRPHLAAIDTLSVVRNTAMDSLDVSLAEVVRMVDTLNRVYEADPNAQVRLKLISAAVHRAHDVLSKARSRVIEDFKKIIEGISGSADDENPERAMVR